MCDVPDIGDTAAQTINTVASTLLREQSSQPAAWNGAARGHKVVPSGVKCSTRLAAVSVAAALIWVKDVQEARLSTASVVMLFLAAVLIRSSSGQPCLERVAIKLPQ